MEMNDNIAQYIEHTLLKPEATETEIYKICQEAREFNFTAVCIQPQYVSLCVEQLQGSGVEVATVVGFPLGANTGAVKAFEARRAFLDGAHDVDMVVNLGALRAKQINKVYADIKGVVEESNAFPDRQVKVIIETCLLTEEEKIVVCRTAVQAGAHYVKTSTGFAAGGATVDDVALMARVVEGRAKIKAAGGIKTLEQAKRFILAGADRIGTSNGIAIMTENSYNEKKAP